MQYLVAQMLTCLLLTGLLGLLIGWLLWGMPLRRSRERTLELEHRVLKLGGFPARLIDLEATHVAFVASKNEETARSKARIAELAPLAALVPGLRANLEAQGAHIADLSAQLEQHAAADAEKDAHIGALLGRMEGVNRDYLAAVLELEQAKAEPLKARAAAASMGFYDTGNGGMTHTVRGAPRDDVREFEKRIEELRSIEASKNDEIAKLRSRLTDVDSAPDPDMRRQILFSAKSSELTHLKGILNSLFLPLSHNEIAVRAYLYAEQRGFSGGSPTEDLFRAERDAHFSRLANAWESTRPGTML
jgi:hypothetical protein